MIPHKRRPRFRRQPIAPLVALLVLAAWSAMVSPEFRQLRNTSNILRQVSYTGIIALGMTFVIVSGGIDLSVGSMLALVGSGALGVLEWIGDRPSAIALAIAAGVGGGIVAGAFNGALIAGFRLAPFVVTLGTMSAFRSLTLYFLEAGEMTSTHTHFPWLGSGRLLGLPVPVWVWAVLALSAHVVLEHTRFGRHVCAVGYNEEVARYSAIRVAAVRCTAYVIAGFTVGVSAVLLAARMNGLSSSTAGLFYELDAIAAVAIGGASMSGGRGTIAGTLVGTLVLGIINNMLNMLGVSPYLQGAVKGVVIILAALGQYRRSPS